MSNINRARSHTRLTDPRSPRRDLRIVRRRPSVALVSAGVVAGYIHDISKRQHPRARGVQVRRHETLSRPAEAIRAQEAEAEAEAG